MEPRADAVVETGGSSRKVASDMDGDFRIDVDEVFRNIDGADVISIYFPLLRKTLLIDTRFSEEDPPMVRVMPMVRTVEERRRALRRLRPQFSRPREIAIVPWPKYVDSLVHLGVWQRVLDRILHLGAIPPAAHPAPRLTFQRGSPHQPHQALAVHARHRLHLRQQLTPPLSINSPVPFSHSPQILPSLIYRHTFVCRYSSPSNIIT